MSPVKGYSETQNKLSKSRNKVSVGEPAEGSLTNPLPLHSDGNHRALVVRGGELRSVH